MAQREKIRVIGLDPGLRYTGWGVIEMHGTKLYHLANGAIHTDTKSDLANRLLQLEQGLDIIFEEYRPDYAAVEQSFVNRDAVASLKLGHARAISLLVPARGGVPLAEYAPTMIKRSIVGTGHANKEQISAMVQLLLPQAKPKNEHAADALAVAITHAHAGDFSGRIKQALQRVAQ